MSGTCQVEGCDHETKGNRRHCDMHRKRLSVRGDVGPVGYVAWPRGTRGCKIPGCPDPHDSLGLCSAHYQRYHASSFCCPCIGAFSGVFTRGPRPVVDDA
jgi:hypothetical protein